MSYELKEYLNSINYTKVNIMDSGDEMYEKKYSSFLVNNKHFLLKIIFRGDLYS